MMVRAKARMRYGGLGVCSPRKIFKIRCSEIASEYSNLYLDSMPLEYRA